MEIGKLPAFGKRQVKKLGRLLQLAREVTAEHFRMGEHETMSLPVEVRTLANLEKNEIRPPGILADICRYQYQDKTFGRRKDLFRVNLQDHNILELLRYEGRPRFFSPLLLYVLTHELVHVVRFVKYLALFYSDENQRLEEERRVHEITQKILRYVPFPGLDAILEYYRPLSEKPESAESLRRHFHSGSV